MIGCALALVLTRLPLRGAGDPYASLRLFQGSWHEMPKGKEPFELTNQCSLIGKYFGCQQTVRGKIEALAIFIPAELSGHYYTQTVLPEGWATGRGELEIEGDHWTFDSKIEDGTKTTYYRTTNEFSGKDRIHYEQLESPDGKQWTTTGSGDELRSTGDSHAPER
jgi:hypothetical protein